MKNKLGKDIWLLFIESSLTSFALFMPVAYLLFKDLGMNQFQIGLTQFIFAITMLVMEVPTGYFADSVSRKFSNALGDIFVATGMLTYFFATGFWHAVIAEVIFGFGLSLTNGADSALLRAHAQQRGLSYKVLAARIQSLSFAASAIGAIIGALIGSYNLRWPFLAQFVIFLAATGFALLIKNSGEKRVRIGRPFKDIARIVKYCLHGHKRLAWRIAVSAALMGSTYMMVWFMTPSFLKAGIDIKYHGLLFAAVSLVAIFGTEFYARSKKLNILTPLLISAVAYFVLGWKTSMLTVLIFLFTSFARGVNTAHVKPYIQEIVPEDIQATALSVYSMFYKIISSSLVLFVNYMANFKLQYGLLTAGTICVIFWLFFKTNEQQYA